MPFLEGPFAFTGKLDMFSAYRMRGFDKIVVRRKGGPSADKVKTSPRFENTRRTMSEFGGCSRHGSYVRKAMLQIRHLSDYNFGSDINSIMRQVQLRDGTGEWGRRRITLSEHTRLLEGFSTTKKAPSFDSIIRTPVDYTMDRANRSVRLEIPELIRDINYFPQNNHAMFRLTVTLGIVPDVTFDVPSKEYLPPPWYNKSYYSKSIPTAWNPSLEGMESTVLELALNVLPPDDRWTLMLSIGIEYGAFRQYGEIQEVPRFGAAKILALRGKEDTSGNGGGNDGMEKNEAPLDNVVTAGIPTLEPESEISVRGPEVKYVYTMKSHEPERLEAKVYSYTTPLEVQDNLRCKPIDPERRQVETDRSTHNHVCENLPDGAGEFETMARTGTGDDDVGVTRVIIDDEIHVGGVGVHAHGGLAEYRVNAEVFTDDTFYPGYFLGGDLTVEIVGVGRLAVMVEGDFQAIAQVGEAVKHGVFGLPDVDRKMIGLATLQLATGVVEPEDYLALDGQRQGQFRHQLPQPCADA
jgi:hypothetical protein